MAASNVQGPRAHGGLTSSAASITDGAYQLPTLGTSAVELDCSDWAGEYVTLRWLPASDGVVVRFLFFAAAAPSKTLDTTTASSASTPAAKVDSAPDWIERGTESVMVPVDRTTLVVAASDAAGGRLVVRQTET